MNIRPTFGQAYAMKSQQPKQQPTAPQFGIWGVRVEHPDGTEETRNYQFEEQQRAAVTSLMTTAPPGTVVEEIDPTSDQLITYSPGTASR